MCDRNADTNVNEMCTRDAMHEMHVDESMRRVCTDADGGMRDRADDKCRSSECVHACVFESVHQLCLAVACCLHADIVSSNFQVLSSGERVASTHRCMRDA